MDHEYGVSEYVPIHPNMALLTPPRSGHISDLVPVGRYYILRSYVVVWYLIRGSILEYWYTVVFRSTSLWYHLQYHLYL
jgi:hypothetical protein